MAGPPKKDRREKDLTAPAASPDSFAPKRRARRRLILALALIALAVGSLGVFERFRQPERAPPAPHGPAQALIAPPPMAPAESSAGPEPAGPPPAPVVVNEADRAPASSDRPVPTVKSSYVIQAGVFTSSANARALRDRLEKAGIRAKVETRVQLGPYQDRSEAEHALARLRELGVDAVLVPAR